MAEIAGSPVMLAEARQALSMLKAKATQPAGASGVQRSLARQFAIYPQPDRTEGEWADFWRLYIDICADLPETALEAGLRKWATSPNSQFLPKPGELRQMSLQAENRAVRSYDRARKACEYQPPKVYDNSHAPEIKPRIIRQEPTQADKDRIRRWAAEYAAQVKTPSVVEPRANHGAVDERGLTAEMRARLSA